ncbi:MarR family winged helix-turn-helix transcriptional regulator [Inquilinus limosus]|uniref:MarR family transcriptional regulator n=1 Tax=Inquilinus limosus MP06 TaxID=1398085 RepID=A0A0A0D134_9PROT|nr:MarR family transcriptional regulator [Inquilinus limosus]KGM31593.1 MarR family transcriptional regulator [Inquilinus limosus MP06]
MPLPKDRPLALDEQICFTLYRTNIAINRTYKPLLDEMGITYPQYLVLNVLGEEDGRTIGAIAARLALESSTITPLVKRMEAAGLVQRRRSPGNEREVQVRLTGTGRDLFGRSRCLGESLLQRSGLTLPQLDALNRQVQALTAALDSGLDRPE